MSRPKGWKTPARLATRDQAPKRRAPYPWATIEIGESFFVANPATAEVGVIKQGQVHGRTFTQTPARELVQGIAFNGARVTRVS